MILQVKMVRAAVAAAVLAMAGPESCCAQSGLSRLDEALFKAAYDGNAARARLLLRRGANPNASNIDGEAVLLSAIDSGNAHVVRLLLMRGASARIQGGPINDTALMQAVDGGNIEIVKLLLEKGVDTAAKDDL